MAQNEVVAAVFAAGTDKENEERMEIRNRMLFITLGSGKRR